MNNYLSIKIKTKSEKLRGFVEIMVDCKKCGTILADNVVTCPICGVDQCISISNCNSTNNISNSSNSSNNRVDNITQKLVSSPSKLILEISEHDAEQKKLETERMIKRGNECFSSGRAWLGAKKRKLARKEFQRAFKYYDNVLKLDPNNEKVREARSKCLLKMA